jgi:ATP-binding cassette subfamily C exporter for protease/lipase
MQSISTQAIASDRAAVSSSFSKFMINMQSSFLLGLAAWLTLEGVLSPALIFIGSMLGGRALTPALLATTHLRSVINAQDAQTRLENFFTLTLPEKTQMKLPEPKGNLLLMNVIAGPPGEDKQVLKGVSLKLAQGQSLAIIGPSASGKSTLAKVISGVWPSLKGEVRLDGVDIFSWNKIELGPYVGYLPQNVELFDGTVASNIARFGEANPSKLNEVIELVGLTDFIKNLPDGLDTQLGFEGSFLSGGQRQRIGLARALYGKPKLVILDEPNSNLDEAGEDALIKAIQAIKLNGSTVILVTHRPRLLSCLDMTLILIDGLVKTFGPTQEVLDSLKRPNSTSNQNQAPPNQLPNEMS